MRKLLLNKDDSTILNKLKENMGMIGISGLGRMGPGIAAGFLLNSPKIKLILHDIDLYKRKNILYEIERCIKLAKHKKTQEFSVAKLKERIIVIEDVRQLKSQKVITAWIETVSEDDESKKQFYKSMGNILSPTIPVFTNTSSRNINLFAKTYEKSSPGAGKMILASHWSNPPTIFPFVELAPTSITQKGLVETWASVLSKNKWTPIIMNKFSDGYILNAIQFSLIDEACHILDEDKNISPKDIDKTTKYLAADWLKNGLIGEKSQHDKRLKIVAVKLTARLKNAIEMLLLRDVATYKDIELIFRYGLCVRWKTLGMLYTADLGKIDLFAEIHKHLMDAYGVNNPSLRLQKMVSLGLLGFNPAKSSMEGFYKHDETSVKNDYKKLTNSYLTQKWSVLR